MTNPLIRIWIHTFFGIKDHMPLIKDSFKKKLEQRISNKLKKEFKSNVQNIKTLENHIHILFMINPIFSLSDILKNIKGESSHWVNFNRFLEAKFAWQKSYVALSVSESQLNNVDNYISEQDLFHKKFTFQEEIEMLLKKINPSKPTKRI